MRTIPILICAVGVSAALAQAVRTLPLTVNGRGSATPAVVMNGRTYVPIEALRTAGVTVTQTSGRVTVSVPAVAAGGANQTAALEGCVGESLFNGVWRARVTNAAAITGPNGQRGYALTFEFRNGTTQQRDLAGTGAAGAVYELNNFQLALKDGSTHAPSGSILDLQAIATRPVPQGAPHVFRLQYFPPAGASGDVSDADRVVVAITPSANVPYAVPNPSLRVRLTCQR